MALRDPLERCCPHTARFWYPNARISTCVPADRSSQSPPRHCLPRCPPPRTPNPRRLYGETNNKQSANQLRIAVRADWAFQPRLSLFAGVAYERNTFAGFDSRTDEIAGLAWKAIVAPNDAMSLDAGGVLTQESDVDGTTHNDPSARFALNYKHAFTKAAYFQQLAEYIPNLNTSGAYRVNTESALVAPLSVHIGVKVGYVVRYNSAPPAKFGTTDRVLTTGVQVSY